MERHDLPQPSEPRAPVRPNQGGVWTRRRIIARAAAIRALLMQAMDRVTADVDVDVCPTFGGGNVLLTNLTGHPTVVLPNGFRASDGTPTSITFTGRLFGEAELLAVAHAYQQATRYHTPHPPLETLLERRPQEKKG